MSEEKQESRRLKVAEVVVSFLTPILVVVVGAWINSNITRQQHDWEVSQAAQQHHWEVAEKILERRVAVVADRRIKSYDNIKEKLNRIHCFITDVGGTWKEETPEKIISYRRIIHQTMYEDRGIWSAATFAAYLDYMDHAAFDLYQGPGMDPRIKTSDVQKRLAIPNWSQAWSGQLTGSIDPEYTDKYKKMYEGFASDIKLEDTGS